MAIKDFVTLGVGPGGSVKMFVTLGLLGGSAVVVAPRDGPVRGGLSEDAQTPGTLLEDTQTLGNLQEHMARLW